MLFSSSSRTGSSLPKSQWAGLGLLILVSVAVYWNSFSNGFVLDDKFVVINEENAQLSSFVTQFSKSDSVSERIETPYYRPLNRATYVLGNYLYGIHPAGYHVENVVIHILCVVSFYFLALRLFGQGPPALIAALLFALHPVNCESVNFISARNNLLATLFVVLAVLSARKAEDDERAPFRFVTALMFFLGLLCKETASMALPLLALWQAPFRTPLVWLREKAVLLWPSLVALVAFLSLRTHALGETVGIDLSLDELGARLLPNLYIIPQYCYLLLVPDNFKVVYRIPEDYLRYLPLLVISWTAILSAAFLICRSRRTVSQFGLLWLSVNFLPISNVVPLTSSPMADRYLYFPCLGLWLILADQLLALYERTSYRRALLCGGALVLTVLASLTWLRTLDWRSEVTLYASQVSVEPDSAPSHYDLCASYIAANDLLSAQSSCAEAVKLDPSHVQALGQSGNLARVRMQPEEAKHFYQEALAVDPGNLKIRYNLATLLQSNGHPREALFHYGEYLAYAGAQDSMTWAVKQRIHALMQLLRPVD
jgi:tetratricopeptide (TPR) repeat protein